MNSDRPDRKAMMPTTSAQSGAAANGGGGGSSGSKAGHEHSSGLNSDRGNAPGKASSGRSAGKGASRGAGSAAAVGSSSRASPAAGAPSSQHAPSTSSAKAKSSHANTASGPASGAAPIPTNPLPLSSMVSPPLDLNSVERRGQPTASREPTRRKARPHDIEDAPTYYPTEEEWKDPMEYMRKISPEARKYGICKVIPPDSWNPSFAIDTQKFHFQTRKQELNSVEGSTRVNLSYLEGLFKYHKNLGNNLTRLPFVDKKPLDLYQLKKAVDSRGGFDMVCKLKKWAEIGRDLGYSGKIMSSLSTSLKNSYQKWLCPYEDFLRLAKPGVHQQLELENGGPFTPSPGASPMKRSSVNTPSSLRGDSPTRVATDALQASISSSAASGDRDTPGTLNSTPPPTSFSNGFTSANGRPLQRDDSSGMLGSRNSSPLTPANGPSESRLGPAHPLKRQLDIDALVASDKDEPVDDDDSGNSRRSKRLKKETIPRVAGSYMSLLRPPQPRFPRDDKGDTKESCEQCGGGEEAGFLAICETCEHAYHGTCLDPPVTSRPDSDWNCPRCLVGDGQFGFEDGGLYSLKQFQEKAADFKQSHFEKKMPFDPVHNCYRPVTEDDVEREFWRLVSSIDETVEVEYGADIHCTTHGSGFPTVEKNPDDPYSTDPWNLNILPLHPESLFRYIKSDISGMTVPWVYVGMIFSTFCWHNEDHYAYSANYQHFGATKTWYGIPGEDAEKFENAMREAVPDLFETQPDLLFQLVTLLPPDKLKKAGVRVYALDQRAGQFVITFPQAYHAGFNHGFNFNEAVNFAPCDWEPFGLAGVERLQQFRRQPCFSHDELLWTAAESIAHTATGGLTIQTAKWLAPALERMQKRESAFRAAFLAKHAELSHGGPLSDKMVTEDTKQKSPLEVELNDKDVPEEEYQCFHCKIFTYLSRFRCSKTGKTFCLEHGGLFQCCQLRESSHALDEGHSLVYRKSAEEMDAMLKKVSEKARLPEAWEEKYEKLLDEGATPSLKSLRALFNEGEKIPYELPSLPLLREFVDRCNRWVEEATTYIVRKQQNRRRTDKSWQVGARKSIGGPADAEDSKGREARSISNIARLLAEAHQIGFDCPEIVLLQQRANAIKIFQEQAKYALDHDSKQTIDTIEKYLDEGQNFNVDLPEVDKLTRLLDQLKWSVKAEASRKERLTLEKISDLLEEGQKLEIPSYNDNMAYINKLSISGMLWERTAKELLNAEAVHYPQLEALCSQATGGFLPVSEATLQSIEQMLHKHRDAHRQIMDMTRRCRDPEFRNRPRYSEVAELMKKIEELQSKPVGTLDLEREHKRNDDWIRKGKKIFGKTNAPLYIFKSHLEYVLDRNTDCFDIIHDKPRTPAEPSSREPTPNAASPSYKASKSREVFCICRRTEAGMMIECEVCREWYHGRCLKIARGKVKDDDKYTCPICDWRVKIPRDAARPDLDSLIALYQEVITLPFQPEEEQILGDIIRNAMDFREAIAAYIDPSLTKTSDAIKQRFYLRKIEGAEVLLTRETNFFRKTLHEKFPVAPSPPEPIEESKSTRKPRPTKLQKMMAQYQVDDPEDLPENVKLRANSLRRKLPSTGLSGDGAPGSYKPPGMADYSSPTSLANRHLDSGLSMPTLHPHKAVAAPSTQSRPAFLDSLNLGRSEDASYSGGQRLVRSPEYMEAMRSGDGAHDGYEGSKPLESVEKNTHTNPHRSMKETDQEEQEWPKGAAASGENNRATAREMGNESRLFPALGTAKAA